MEKSPADRDRQPPTPDGAGAIVHLHDDRLVSLWTYSLPVARQQVLSAVPPQGPPVHVSAALDHGMHGATALASFLPPPPPHPPPPQPTPRQQPLAEADPGIDGAPLLAPPPPGGHGGGAHAIRGGTPAVRRPTHQHGGVRIVEASNPGPPMRTRSSSSLGDSLYGDFPQQCGEQRWWGTCALSHAFG